MPNKQPRLCEVCGREIAFGSKRYRYCSQRCADIGEKRRANEATAGRERASLYINRQCPMCGVTYYGHIKSYRCLDCQMVADKQHKAESMRRAKLGKARTIGSIDRCEACGAEYMVNSGLQKYCKACAATMIRKNDRAASRAWNKEAYSTPEGREKKNASRRVNAPKQKNCAYCGKVFSVSVHARNYCSQECREKAKKEYLTNYEANRSSAKTGVPGVKVRQTATGTVYTAQITRAGNVWSLGTFNTLEEATEARRTAEQQFQCNDVEASSQSAKTGIPGVSIRHTSRHTVYTAQIRIAGKLHHLGTFPTLEKAIQARKEAEEQKKNDP